MKTVKAKSSKYINDKKFLLNRFEWQEGYGSFFYSHSQIKNIYNYIANQEQHQKKQIFKEEYVKLLDDFEISYNENYLFEDLK